MVRRAVGDQVCQTSGSWIVWLAELWRTWVDYRGSGLSLHVDGTSAADLLPIIKRHVHPKSRVMTDEAGQ